MDDGNTFDSTRTSLHGTAGQLWLGKIGGVTRFGTSYRYFSPGFDPNDIGFINEANHRSWVVDAGLQSTHASSWYRNAGVSLLHITWWSGSGRIEDEYFLNAVTELHSQWVMNVMAGAQQMTASTDQVAGAAHSIAQSATVQPGSRLACRGCRVPCSSRCARHLATRSRRSALPWQ